MLQLTYIFNMLFCLNPCISLYITMSRQICKVIYFQNYCMIFSANNPLQVDSIDKMFCILYYVHTPNVLAFTLPTFLVFFFQRKFRTAPLLVSIIFLMLMQVFNSFKPKAEKLFINSQPVMLHQPGRPMFVFSKKTKQFFWRRSMGDLYGLLKSVNQFQLYI